MHYVLYNHVGSANHGCEALVRTLSELLDRKRVLLLSDSPEEEIKYGVDHLVKVKPSMQPINKKSFDFVKAYIKLKLTGNYFYMDIQPYKKTINELCEDDVLVSIGGDIFCYENYPKYVLLHKYALKKVKHSILLGCSIDPSTLSDKSLVEDLKSFELITAREHITYDALVGVGLTNVFYCPDSAFILPAKETTLPPNFLINNTIGLNISPLVLNKSNDPKLLMNNFRCIIEDTLNTTDSSIALIPHVIWDKNDDRQPLMELYQEYSSSGRICVIADQNAEQLKYIISQCSFFIGARTHATIAAYSSFVPTLVLGYSVKSKGIARDLFGSEDRFVVSYDTLISEDSLLSTFEYIKINANSIREILKKQIPIFQDSVIDTFKRIIIR